MIAPPLRTTAALAVIAVAGLVVYLGVVTAQVLLGTDDDELHPSGAIVVLGAAQYDGVPSPALAQRLERALELWQQGVAPRIVVTGGQQPGDRFDEATASRTWLFARGVPEDRILREIHGRNTYDQLAATARFLRDDGVEQVVLVSDPLHATRLRMVAAEVGLQASVSSTRSPTRDWRGISKMAVREVAAVAAGQAISFRRLRNITAGEG